MAEKSTNGKFESKNSKYEFKTVKVRPVTYKKIVKCKSRIESINCELLSFDSVINHLVDNFLEDSIKKIE